MWINQDFAKSAMLGKCSHVARKRILSRKILELLKFNIKLSVLSLVTPVATVFAIIYLWGAHGLLVG
jgi:hypothetical protein